MQESPQPPATPWLRRGPWQIDIRWWVAPLMVAGLGAGKLLGFELSTGPILLIAASTLAYNATLAWVLGRYRSSVRDRPDLARALTGLEVVLDYVAIFLLIFFTGGTSSPLVVFLVFHVIISAIQLSPAAAYQLAGLAAGGLWLMLLAQVRGWIELPRFAFAGQPLTLVDRPVFEAVLLFFFTATLFITAALTTQIMRRLRQRVDETTRVSQGLATANERLRGLYTLVTSIGAERHLDVVLATVTAELSTAAAVPAVSVKLLDDDGRTLRYVAAHGLPREWLETKALHLDRSPLNRRCIEGETLVSGRIEDGEQLELRQELQELGFRSAVLAPLRVTNRVIGTLGFYSPIADAFSREDTPFLRLAAELVAIAIDNARAYEAIETILHERAQSMLEVAHNLRAPLGAGLSMLDLLSGGYLGDLTAEQVSHLERLEERLRSLDKTIGDLLTIARSRDRSREIPDVVVDLEQLARKTERTFADDAANKGLRFEVIADGGLPAIPSGVDLLDQVMENLVSNAIKYTPRGGEVKVRFSPRGPEGVRISVRDTGIGIPAGEQNKLFQEFFRASNAKRVTTQGTGLGLALVKRAVGRHHGLISVESEEGKGTAVTVDLPGGRPASRLPELA
jgi:signal transduction histidine kinase